MLMVRLGPHVLVVQKLLHLYKQHVLLVVVMRLDKLVPRQTVSHKVPHFRVLDVLGLVEDGVVPADDGVVQEGHVRCARGEQVGLSALASRTAGNTVM